MEGATNGHSEFVAAPAWRPLPGGGNVLVDGAGEVLLVEDFPEDRDALLERVELFTGRWLEWANRWRTRGGPGARVARPVVESRAQPSHRLEAVWPDGQRREALLLVDETRSPDGEPIALSWTHREWDDPTGAFEGGGEWYRAQGVWRHATLTTMTCRVTVRSIR